jgi:hypothetical protein
VIVRRISSSMSYHLKRTIPLLILGALSAALAAALLNRPRVIETVMVFAVALVAGASLIYWFMRDVLDEVFDDGDRLLVRNGGVEETMLLRDVASVSALRNRTLVRVTLVMAAPEKFGGKIVFLARDTFLDAMPHGPPALAKELESRIAALKQNSTREP